MSVERGQEGVTPETFEQKPETPEGVEAAREVINEVKEADEDTLKEVQQARERMKNLGGAAENLKEAEQQASEEFQNRVSLEKLAFLGEFVNAAPDVLRHRVNEAASYLHTIKNPSSEALEKEFALDPETARVYYSLSQSFGETVRKPESEVEQAGQPRTEQVSKAEKTEKTEPGQIQVGSMVRMSGWAEPRRVIEITKPEQPGGSRYVYVEGIAKGIITSDVEVVPEKKEKADREKPSTERPEKATKAEGESSKEAPAEKIKKKPENWSFVQQRFD
ncbi:MAG: hypothetical protein G01um1014107_164 [Parcubacteria group bacterium Gr01-1014_107]|nr:MAG: hypothetical protein G01um1014107_164 [Parcubacteria group bacterium Gr01-1014_107]